MPPTELKKVFTYEQARRLLPLVKERTREALDRFGAVEFPPAEAEDETLSEQVQQAAAKILAEWAGEVQALGAEVKGPWLVDFDSGGGYYCWKWPEESLEYFHGYEEGFTGRVRIQ